MTLNLTAPAGEQPRRVLIDVLVELTDQIWDFNRASQRPPQLFPAIEAARQAQRAEDVQSLQRALINVAHGAIASLVLIRAVTDHDDE